MKYKIRPSEKKNIKLILYDFDGVMTDNCVYVDENGIESVKVNRGDGLGVSEIKKMGIIQKIISTEKNNVVATRASKLDIECYHGVSNKAEYVKTISSRLKIIPENIAFVGNDINDLEAMQEVGLKICPSDARREILDISDIVLKTKGGKGVVREIFDLLVQDNI